MQSTDGYCKEPYKDNLFEMANFIKRQVSRRLMKKTHGENPLEITHLKSHTNTNS